MLTQPSYRSLRNPVVAIVGATGAVGAELIRCLEERDFPVTGLRLLASARSAGKVLQYRGQDLMVGEVSPDSFRGVELALFAADSETSRTYAPIAQASSQPQER